MEFQDYLSIVRKRWVSIFLIAALVTAAAVAATLAATPLYQAHAQVYVSVRTSGTTADLLQGSNFTQRQVSSYAELATTPRVLVPVIEHLDLPTTPDALAGSIVAGSMLDSSLINIRVTHSDPSTASDIANSTAESLASEVGDLERPEGGVSPVQISTVRVATPPESPSSPNTTRNLALGVLVGLGLGFGVAVLRELLDTRVRTEDDVRAVTDISVIATIPVDDDAEAHPLILQASPHSQRAESLRRLRTNLQFLDVSGGPQMFVVTSALPVEGKSTTSINLAIALADGGARVALVDADLRRPSVGKYMGLEGAAGLTTVLIGRATIEDVIQPWGNGKLHVLPSGQIPPNPSELLGSRAMADLLAHLAANYDVVLIDTPPLLPVTDAAILARLTSGALLVVSADKLHRHQLKESIGALEAVGARILGIVINRLERKQSAAYSYYDYTPAAPDGEKTVKRAGRTEPTTTGRIPVAHARVGQKRSARRTNRPPVTNVVNTLDDTIGEQNATLVTRWPGEPRE
ncbi:polysaccharide biosynthesis tyrosine autokinase [Cellulomonas sp. S1-8]|uniref:polysaccharide biosynthesis tyrosine autokinase n=1 Tax=Cellulomonas sp. S1-8 TaxID=2904790 RepID=UPI002243E050|nr:polysaccharide biosynthesis tyrosine autokinase [Cellulomonas sp. S1-8]UZN04147.1 polysaccharide biosynthesis tyrosine autokinase [Cellulomonas sp. S1-8]